MTETTETPQTRPTRARHLPLIAIAAVAVVGALTLRDQLDFEALAAHREALIALRDANYAGAALGFMLAYVAIVAFSLPGATVATLAGGFLFGVFPGVLFNVTAATLGAVLIFLAARWGLGDRLAARLDASEGRVAALREGLRENELSVLFLIRLVPAVPFFVANLLPALVGVSAGRFAVTTFFGIMPGALVYTWVGAGLGEVFARGERPDLGIVFEPQVLGPLLGLAALAALPIVLRALRRRR
ncbi:TVP38/TMEM64 family protein [Rhodovulum kholense]|uniref:TVP38/TMEM64 family membrane protein n=1 Tax=Rhodovulum kholense TaxID=453584 RepID=A0A8E2VHU2_9RHOB|nr:TVP38/TMEM64 family protein [Rhodovulum kholense]PTW40824.1 putative membrane protein YdjX (TVP38/TMEM64 family) [Rhodovulum kholense]